MQVSSPPEQTAPLVLTNLPDPDGVGDACPRRTRVFLDLLLLALEALNLGGAEDMLVAVQDLHLQSIIPSRVMLWRLRSTNPLRRFSQRRPLSLAEGKALVAIICYLARRQTVTIRQLLLAQAQLRGQQHELDQHLGLATYLERFRRHFRSRMNPNRSAIAAYKDDAALDELALTLLGRLLFCTGTVGEQRLWASLFDGEVV